MTEADSVLRAIFKAKKLRELLFCRIGSGRSGMASNKQQLIHLLYQAIRNLFATSSFYKTPLYISSKARKSAFAFRSPLLQGSSFFFSCRTMTCYRPIDPQFRQHLRPTQSPLARCCIQCLYTESEDKTDLNTVESFF